METVTVVERDSFLYLPYQALKMVQKGCQKSYKVRDDMSQDFEKFPPGKRKRWLVPPIASRRKRTRLRMMVTRRKRLRMKTGGMPVNWW